MNVLASNPIRPRTHNIDKKTWKSTMLALLNAITQLKPFLCKPFFNRASVSPRTAVALAMRQIATRYRVP